MMIRRDWIDGGIMDEELTYVVFVADKRSSCYYSTLICVMSIARWQETDPYFSEARDTEHVTPNEAILVSLIILKFSDLCQYQVC